MCVPCHTMNTEARGYLEEVGSTLPSLYGFQGSNSGPSSLVAGTFTHWTISPALIFSYKVKTSGPGTRVQWRTTYLICIRFWSPVPGPALIPLFCKREKKKGRKKSHGLGNTLFFLFCFVSCLCLVFKEVEEGIGSPRSLALEIQMDTSWHMSTGTCTRVLFESSKCS